MTNEKKLKHFVMAIFLIIADAILVAELVNRINSKDSIINILILAGVILVILLSLGYAIDKIKE